MAEDLPHVGGGGGSAGGKKPGSSFLSKKAVGGMTVGTIILIAAGAYIVLRFYKSRNSSSSTSAAQSAAAQAAAQQAAQDQLYGAPSPGSAGPSTSTGTGGGASYTDNVSWQSAAVNYLVARGYDSVLANQAIGDYLAGNTLTTQEHALVNLAVAAIGAPPVAPPPALVVSPPVTGPPTTGGGGVGGGPVITPIQGGHPPGSVIPPVPVTLPVPVQNPLPPSSAGYEQVTVVKFGNPAPWNSTISGIAQHYGYGGDWETVWNDPRNAGLKSKRGKPELIQAGDVVFVKRR